MTTDVPPWLADFAARLASLAADDRFAGTVIVRSRDEPVFASAYGSANRAWRAPCALDTRFDIASITKLLTAVAALQLVEQGAFALDTSVVEYLELVPTSISPAVTAHQLLTHTSGIADDADEETERYEDLFLTEPTYAFRQIADNLPHFAQKPPNFPPGEGCRYCNSGYLLLGLMIERASGASYREYVSTKVLTPAGMSHSGFFAMDVVEPNVAEGVEAILDGDKRVVGWRRNIYSYPPVGDSAGGAHATVGDLLAFHTALRAGRLLGPELTAAVLLPHAVYRPQGGRTRMTGYGFEFVVTGDGRVRYYEKEGANVGASGLVRHYPDHDLTLAILGIGERAVWEPVAVFDAAVD